MEEESILAQKQSDIDYIVQKAMNQALASAAAEATRIARESTIKKQEDLIDPPTPQVEVKRNIVLGSEKSFDGYLENKRVVMERGTFNNPSKIQPSALPLFHDVNNIFAGPNGDVLPPFYVQLFEQANGTYVATINYGLVIEVNRSKVPMNDAIVMHVPTNWDIEHIPSNGKALYIYVREDASGLILNTEAFIFDDNQVSTNYGNAYGGGDYWYKLAYFDLDAQNKLRVNRECSGSHIYHETGLTSDLVVYGCSDGESGGTMLARLRFNSGRLAGINEPTETINLSSNLVDFEVRSCADTDAPTDAPTDTGTPPDSDTP